MGPAANEAIDPSTGEKPNRLWIGGLLTGLIAAHVGVGIFLCPVGRSGDDHGIKLLLIVAPMGIIFGQPSLLAIAAVFAPVRLVTRFLISGALVVPLWYATLWGISNNMANHRVHWSTAVVLFGFVRGFLVFQLRLWIVRGLGDWGVVVRRGW
jgi:hypothetical protein